MSSARRPEHGGSAPLGVLPVLRTEPGFDTTPAPLLPEFSPREAQPTHLLPCVQCGALNGRSAMVCWGCEADLLAIVPFAHVAAPRPPEAVVVPVVHQQVVVERDGTAEGQRGLHLVARIGAPASVQPMPGLAPPDFSADLPVLTTQVEDPASAPVMVKARRPYPVPMIALVLAAVLPLVVAAGLRWWGAPAARVSLLPGFDAAHAVGALERPFAAPVPSNAADPVRLSFPPLEVSPGDAAAGLLAQAPARTRATPTARAGGKTRATRPAEAPAAGALAPTGTRLRQRNAAPAHCTSNMAALGFCTLEPAPAKE